MEYLSSDKIKLKKDGIYFDEKLIDMSNFQYLYISGYHSGAEYYDNLDRYIVELKTKDNFYQLIETKSKSSAKFVFKYAKAFLKGENIKRYNNAVVNLDCVRKTEAYKRDTSKSCKTAIIMKDGKRLRVLRSPFKQAVKIYREIISKDLEKYKQSKLTMQK